MAKANKTAKHLVIETSEALYKAIAEITKKPDTYTVYKGLFKQAMGLSPLAKNDGLNLAHWLLKPACFSRLAKIDLQACINLSVSLEALAGVKIELHRCQQACLTFWSLERGYKLSFDRKGYHSLIDLLTAKKAPAKKPVKPAKATATTAPDTAPETADNIG